MPRPKVNRVARNIRLPAEVDADLVAAAEETGVSVNEAVELAVRAWVRLPVSPGLPAAAVQRVGSAAGLSMSLAPPGPPIKREPIPKRGK